MPLSLRPYQAQAIEDLRCAYRSGARAPLLVLPTGGGKTHVFSAVTHGASSKGLRVLILVHRRELIRQASRKLDQLRVPHGVIAAGFPASDALVQVASVQTLARRSIDWQPSLIVIDEAHHAVAGSWAQIIARWPDALRLGVTATPMRKDGRGLGAAFDRLVLGPSVEQLVSGGFLTAARIFAPPIKADLSQLRARAGDYTPEDAAAAMDRPTITGDAIEHYRRHANGLPAIAFCCTVAHAEAVAADFRAAGFRAQTILGCHPADHRDQLIADLGSGALQILVSVDVVSEGTDIPVVAAAILLRPTQSEALYLQQVGRVLRPAEGKAHALILDHCGNVLRHGFPDDHRDYGLDDRRRRMARSGPPAPAVRQCTECFAAFKPQPLCPVCGASTQPSAREISKQEGELRELKRAEVQLRAKAQRREVGRARTLAQLLSIAQERGYSPGWAYRLHQARARHG